MQEFAVGQKYIVQEKVNGKTFASAYPHYAGLKYLIGKIVTIEETSNGVSIFCSFCIGEHEQYWYIRKEFLLPYRPAPVICKKKYKVKQTAMVDI